MDLAIYCSTDRAFIKKPFSFGAYTFATNGHILVRVKRRKNVPKRDDAPNDSVRNLIAKYAVKEHRPLGKFKLPHPRRLAATPTGINGVSFSSHYVRMLLALPGIKVATTCKETEAMHFVFDGGDGLLMPMRADPEIEEQKAA